MSDLPSGAARILNAPTTATALAAAASTGEKRRPPLLPALDLTWGQSFADALAVARSGGPVPFGLRNSGLAPAHQAFIELVEVVHRVVPPQGHSLFVFQQREGANPFWRRPRRGEVLAPDAIVATTSDRTIGTQPRLSPGDLVGVGSGDQRPRLVGRAPVGSLAPREAVIVEVPTPRIDPDDEPDGIWTWCLVVRCFDLLQEPATPVLLPTPPQPLHHVRLMCLHDTSG